MNQKVTISSPLLGFLLAMTLSAPSMADEPASPAAVSKTAPARTHGGSGVGADVSAASKKSPSEDRVGAGAGIGISSRIVESEDLGADSGALVERAHKLTTEAQAHVAARAGAGKNTRTEEVKAGASLDYRLSGFALVGPTGSGCGPAAGAQGSGNIVAGRRLGQSGRFDLAGSLQLGAVCELSGDVDLILTGGPGYELGIQKLYLKDADDIRLSHGLTVGAHGRLAKGDAILAVDYARSFADTLVHEDASDIRKHEVDASLSMKLPRGAYLGGWVSLARVKYLDEGDSRSATGVAGGFLVGAGL